MSFKRVLITGGAGFIGSHLVDALLEAGRQVTIVDNLSTGRWRNVAHHSRHPSLRVLIASASDERLMDEEIRQHDLVYHLASAVGVKLIMQQPVKTIDTIVLSTEVVLRLCSRYRRPVLLTSTSEIYGKSTQVPFRETDDVVMGATEKRRWAYACAKAMDEFLARAHYYETQLPVFIVRLFNTVGPRQTGHYGMVIPTFVRQALDGVPLTVYGTGQQKRCFCSAFDVVQGLIRLPEVEESTGMVVNLGSQNENLDREPRPACRRGHRVLLRPMLRPLRGSLRRGLRRHVPARPGPDARAAARRLGAALRDRRHHPAGGG